MGYCQRIAATLEDLQTEFTTAAEDAGGLVRVAASTVIAQYRLLPSLAGLNERHSRLHVELQVSDRMADMARDGIDIAIRTTAALPQTVIARKAFQRHRLATNSAATHLNNLPFLVDGQSVSLAAKGYWRSNDTGLAASMVLQGIGIGRLATIVAEPLVHEGRLVPLLAAFVDQQPIPVYAATRARSNGWRPCTVACSGLRRYQHPVDHVNHAVGG